MPKKISVNFSTLVDLKAELFRKQEQASRQKEEQQKDKTRAEYVKGKKPILLEARKAAAIQEKQLKGLPSAEKRRRLEQLEASVKEEERQLARSRQRLEEKAALYEKLKCGRDEGTSDSNELYLVNFERKAFDDRRKSDDSDQEASDHELPSTSGGNKDEEDWVEYTDVLGRTRKCLRQDLPNFVAADEKLKERRRADDSERMSHPSTSLPNVNEKSELLSEDMRRELKRKAWEREEEEAALPRGPVHYQHVAQGESRELGVGYFPFAPDEQTRHDQMKLLDDLRQQTLSQRERSRKVKEKRQAALKARLEKVKERKNLNEGDTVSRFLADSDDEDPSMALDDIPLPPVTSSTGSDQDDIGPLPPTAPAKQQVRPWDVGKPKVPREDWTETRRKDRNQEFAPPSFY